jgi:hypothetical protein
MEIGERVQVEACKLDGARYRWWHATVEAVAADRIVLVMPVAAKPWAMGDWGSAAPIALCGIALGVAHLTHPAHP